MRKHGGRQPDGWQFDLRHLHAKSASLSPFKRFAFELRDIAQRQPLPGYRLAIEAGSKGRELLTFATDLSTGGCGQNVDGLVPSGTNGHVLSGTGVSCYQEPKTLFSSIKSNGSDALNLDSNLESNSFVVGDPQKLWISSGCGR